MNDKELKEISRINKIDFELQKSKKEDLKKEDSNLWNAKTWYAEGLKDGQLAERKRCLKIIEDKFERWIYWSMEQLRDKKTDKEIELKWEDNIKIVILEKEWKELTQKLKDNEINSERIGEALNQALERELKDEVGK